VARERPGLAHPGVPREVDRYLVLSEKIVFSTRLHLYAVFWPLMWALLGLIALIYFESVLADTPRLFRDALLIGWLLLLLRALWAVLEWYVTIVLCTNRRLIMVNGIVVRKVNMMPLGKVTDMRYDRSPLGQVLGFGTFVLESAGQDQALSTITPLPRPDTLYRKINQALPPAEIVTESRIAPSAQSLPVQEPNEAWWKRR
jgi:membrane protein YdbS with pleckstrin-like domain